MASTIWSGKRVAAVPCADGTITYFLFSKTHDSNVDPAIPRWHCFAIGTYEQVLKVIHEYMRSCEGGSTRSRTGNVTPENFLAAWYVEFNRPYAFASFLVNVNLLSIRYGVENGAEKVVSILSAAGFDVDVEKLRAGEVTIDPVRDMNIMLQLYGEEGVLSPWSAISLGDVCTSVPVPELRPMLNGRGAAQKAAAPNVLIVTKDAYLVAQPGKGWSHWGYAYEAIGRFAVDVGYQLELCARKSSLPALAAFRKACDHAEPVPDEATIEVTVAPPGTHSWRIKSAHEVVSRLCGITLEQAAQVERITTTFGDVRKNERVLRELAYLSDQQLKWDLPVEGRTLHHPIPQQSLAQSQIALF